MSSTQLRLYNELHLLKMKVLIKLLGLHFSIIVTLAASVIYFTLFAITPAFIKTEAFYHFVQIERGNYNKLLMH